MALISCPECNREISDKAESCPHCGYPIQNKHKENELYDIAYYGTITKTAGDRARFTKFIIDIKKIDLSSVVKLINVNRSTLFEGLSLKNATTLKNLFSAYAKIEIMPSTSTISENDKVDDYISNITAPVTCPRCGSTAITTGERGFSLISGFLGSNKTTNRCAKCGWSWQP